MNIFITEGLAAISLLSSDFFVCTQLREQPNLHSQHLYIYLSIDLIPH